MAEKKKPKLAPAELELRRTQSEHEESGSIIFDETRGVRNSSETFLFSDLEDTLSLGNYAGYVEADINASFFEAANYWLKEVGEKDSHGVRGDADKAKQSVRTWKQKKKIDRRTFQGWWFEIGKKHGFLSPVAVAAKFLAASDFIDRLTKGNQQLKRAIYQFADAWHWMHFEAKGEHKLAAVELKSLGGRAQGPAGMQKKAARRKKIIEDLYEKYASDEKNGDARKNAKRAAGALLKKVNQQLKKHGIREIAEDPLIDELRPLVNKHFPKRR